MPQPSLFSLPLPNWRVKIGGSEFKVMRLNDAAASNTSLTSPDLMADYFRPRLAESIIFRPAVENFMVCHLNTRIQPIGFEIISQGTLDTLLVHPREVFKSAIVANSHSIVVAHNHPSGNPSPSEADVKVTRDLMRAGQLLKIEVLDHLILGRSGPDCAKGYISLRELGFFYTS